MMLKQSFEGQIRTYQRGKGSKGHPGGKNSGYRSTESPGSGAPLAVHLLQNGGRRQVLLDQQGGRGGESVGGAQTLSPRLDGSAAILCRWAVCVTTNTAKHKRGIPMSRDRNQGSQILGSEEGWKPTHLISPPPSLYSCPRLTMPWFLSSMRRGTLSPNVFKDFQTVTGSWPPVLGAVKPRFASPREDCKNDLWVTIRLPSLMTSSIFSARWPRSVLQDHRQFYLPLRWEGDYLLNANVGQTPEPSSRVPWHWYGFQKGVR